MKRLGKVICFTAVVSAVAGGIAYLMKKNREKAVPELEEENGDTFEEDLKDLFDDFKDETKGKACCAKETVSDLKDEFQEKAVEVKEKACTVKEQVKDAAGEIKEQVKDTAGEIKETLSGDSNRKAE